MRWILLAGTLCLATACQNSEQVDPSSKDETSDAQAIGENAMAAKAPEISQDHKALLASDDPALAANKQLVYDMYRILLQAGFADRAGEFIAQDYIQHNPMAAQGLEGIQEYVRKTRPEREVKDAVDLPLIHMMAEGNHVQIAFVRPEKDDSGETYYSTWFDLFRIEDGKIAEHWDPMLKSDVPIDPNDKKIEN